MCAILRVYFLKKTFRIISYKTPLDFIFYAISSVRSSYGRAPEIRGPSGIVLFRRCVRKLSPFPNLAVSRTFVVDLPERFVLK